MAAQWCYVTISHLPVISVISSLGQQISPTADLASGLAVRLDSSQGNITEQNPDLFSLLFTVYLDISRVYLASPDIVDIALLCMIIRYHSTLGHGSVECGVWSVASLYDTLSNPFLRHTPHQAEMAGTPFLLASVLISTIVYSDLQFTLESDPLINHNLLAYLSSREDLVSYLSSYSNNIADTTLGSSLSSAGTKHKRQ